MDKNAHLPEEKTKNIALRKVSKNIVLCFVVNYHKPETGDGELLSNFLKIIYFDTVLWSHFAIERDKIH